MSKLIKWIWTAVILLALFCLGVLLADKQYLRNEIVRLRVVADSNSTEDQRLKITVRDAITAYLNENMCGIADAEAAKMYLQEHTEQLQTVALRALRKEGSRNAVSVYLSKEAAGVREYDTFCLPSGVYETLRVDIGRAEGNNWWCVVFPSLCLPATVETFQQTAVSSGFDTGLTNALAADGSSNVRFFLLDCLGRLENLLHHD